MLLPISALLFSLVALELSATVRKSTEEGLFAFMSPRLQASKNRVISEKLDELLEMKDARAIESLLVESGVMGTIEQKLEELETLESSIAKNMQDHYNQILSYLPEDLREFFGTCEVMWDVENLKLLLCRFIDEKHYKKQSNFADHYGHVSHEAIESLVKSGSVEEMLKNAAKLLPTEFTFRVDSEKETCMTALGFALDLAAFEFLRKKSSGMKTKRVQMAWNFLCAEYETENIVRMSRLKHSNTPNENIKRYLFPINRRLDSAIFRQLLETQNYDDFLEALQSTPYGKSIQRRDMNPEELENVLKRELRKLEFEESHQDTTMIIVTRLLSELEAQYGIIRKAAFFVHIRDKNEA